MPTCPLQVGMHPDGPNHNAASGQAWSDDGPRACLGTANLKVGSACGVLDKLPLHWPLAQCSVGPGPLEPRLALAAPRPKTAGARGRAEPGQRRARGASLGPYRPLAGARLQLATRGLRSAVLCAVCWVDFNGGSECALNSLPVCTPRMTQRKR